MNVLVLGASGETGRHLVKMLLELGNNVTIIVRSPGKLPDSVRSHDNLTTIEATLLDLSDDEIAKHVKECDAVASCLGHNLTFKGMYGQPRKLVAEAERRICEAIQNTTSKEKPVKFVLMNSSGVVNDDANEQISIGQKIVVGLIRLLVPPHIDNELAAKYLRTQIGKQNRSIEWTAVRPDGLVNEETITPYEAHPSPTRSAIFDAGKVSRINVAHFMAQLISDDSLWQKWKGKMPVLYGAEST